MSLCDYPLPGEPPGARFKNRKPTESEGFGAVARIPPRVAQSPTATTNVAVLISNRIGKLQSTAQITMPLRQFTAF